MTRDPERNAGEPEFFAVERAYAPLTKAEQEVLDLVRAGGIEFSGFHGWKFRPEPWELKSLVLLSRVTGVSLASVVNTAGVLAYHGQRRP